MYTLEKIIKKLGKNPQEIKKVCRKFQIGPEFSENDLEFLRRIFDANKDVLLERCRQVLTEAPFMTEIEIAHAIHRPLSYIRWLLPLMTEEFHNLAETDEGKLFLLNRHTIAELKLSPAEHEYAMDTWGRE